MKKYLTGFLALSLSVFLAGSSFARVTGDPPSTADAWCAGPSGAEICVNSDGDVVPTTDNDGSLGTTSLEYKNIYIDGTVYLDSADITTDQLRFAVHHAVDAGNEEGSFVPVDNAALVISLSDEDLGTGYGTLKIRTFYRRVPTTL